MTLHFYVKRSKVMNLEVLLYRLRFIRVCSISHKRFTRKCSYTGLNSFGPKNFQV